MNFSIEKNKIMIVNRSEDERDAIWRLGVNELQQVCENKYLGIWM